MPGFSLRQNNALHENGCCSVFFLSIGMSCFTMALANLESTSTPTGTQYMNFGKDMLLLTWTNKRKGDSSRKSTNLISLRRESSVVNDNLR